MILCIQYLFVCLYRKLYLILYRKSYCLYRKLCLFVCLFIEEDLSANKTNLPSLYQYHFCVSNEFYFIFIFKNCKIPFQNFTSGITQKAEHFPATKKPTCCSYHLIALIGKTVKLFELWIKTSSIFLTKLSVWVLNPHNQNTAPIYERFRSQQFANDTK